MWIQVPMALSTCMGIKKKGLSATGRRFGLAMLFLSMVFGFEGLSAAATPFHRPAGSAWPETTTGTVRDIGRNSIEIYDEQDGRPRTFIDVAQDGQWHKGDYVRIDYWPNGNRVEHIRKITPLPYKKNGRNLGRITRAVPHDTAVRIIVSEAADQGLKGMTCVGEVLRRRGSVKGFYGYRSGHADREPASVWAMAASAWQESAHTNYTKGADHFENVRQFGTPRWAKDCVKTYEYRDHVFYKEVRA